jgi:hypothetical protein
MKYDFFKSNVPVLGRAKTIRTLGACDPSIGRAEGRVIPLVHH